MNEELKKFLMNVQHFFDIGEITKNLEEIQAEYKRYNEPEVGIQTGFGHVFSKTRCNTGYYIKAVFN